MPWGGGQWKQLTQRKDSNLSCLWICTEVVTWSLTGRSVHLRVCGLQGSHKGVELEACCRHCLQKEGTVSLQLRVSPERCANMVWGME